MILAAIHLRFICVYTKPRWPHNLISMQICINIHKRTSYIILARPYSEDHHQDGTGSSTVLRNDSSETKPGLSYPVSLSLAPSCVTVSLSVAPSCVTVSLSVAPPCVTHNPFSSKSYRSQ